MLQYDKIIISDNFLSIFILMTINKSVINSTISQNSKRTQILFDHFPFLDNLSLSFPISTIISLNFLRIFLIFRAKINKNLLFLRLNSSPLIQHRLRKIINLFLTNFEIFISNEPSSRFTRRLSITPLIYEILLSSSNQFLHRIAFRHFKELVFQKMLQNSFSEP